VTRSFALLLSLAVNIFLAAFLLGRASTGLGGLDLGHLSPFHTAAVDAGFCHHGGLPGEMPPPPDGGLSGPPHHPPFIHSNAVFSEEEMAADEPFIKQEFAKIRELRTTFIQQLATGEVSEHDIDQHFIAVEKVMDELKDHVRKRVAKKIGAMTPEERKQLSERLRICDSF
jgi:hypothetical protein